jgi:membrane protein
VSERPSAGDRHGGRGTDAAPDGDASTHESSPSVAGEGQHTARARFDAVSQPIRNRLEEPISKVSTLTNKTLALFPVRVWRHFLARNGFLLSAGMSYQALFAIFAAVYVVFAVAGIWLTGNPDTLEAFILLLNTYAPGLIGDDGIISQDALIDVATTSTSLFGWTGAVALAGLIWTAIAWITYARMAVRSIFGLPKDTRSYLLLKARDFLAGLAFGTIILIATVLSVVATTFFGWLLGLLGLSGDSGWSSGLLQSGALLVVFVIDTLALAVLFRFLSGAAMPWRWMWAGSLLGSAAISLLQFLGGFLLTGTGNNPLLATFAVFIGLLLWFRLTSIVMLVAASWIAVEAADAHATLRSVTPEQLVAEEREREQLALVTAARVRVREATSELATANWLERIPARRRLARAEDELARAEASLASATTEDEV